MLINWGDGEGWSGGEKRVYILRRMDGHGNIGVGMGFGYGVDNDTGRWGPTGHWGSLGSVGMHRVYVVKVLLRTVVDLIRLQGLGVGMRNSITVGICSLIGRSSMQLDSWICHSLQSAFKAIPT